MVKKIHLTRCVVLTIFGFRWVLFYCIYACFQPLSEHLCLCVHLDFDFMRAPPTKQAKSIGCGRRSRCSWSMMVKIMLDFFIALFCYFIMIKYNKVVFFSYIRTISTWKSKHLVFNNTKTHIKKSNNNKKCKK